MTGLELKLLMDGVNAIGSGIASKNAADELSRRQVNRGNQAIGQGRDMADEALMRRQQYGLGTSMQNLRRLINEGPASDFLRRQAARGQADSLNALSRSGARAALGGVGAVNRATQDRLSQIAYDDAKFRAQGLNLVGTAEQRVAENRLVDARTDLGRGRDMMEAGRAQRFAGEDLALQGQLAGQQATMQGISSGITSLGDFEGVDPELLNATTMEDGGVMRGKSPGEFSHDRNPIDIIRQGEKVGEMTGGEGIVSPEDLGKLEQLAGDGGSPLHRFVRELIRKLEKNEG